MSISVDDLVASLNANHIGQEALDLAALQAHLAQTLFNSASTSQPSPDLSHRPFAQPSNTPTNRTPSASFSMDQPDFSPLRRRRSSAASTRMRVANYDDQYLEREPDFDEMDEDERMVEDLLCPASPIAAGATVSSLSQSPPLSPTSSSYHNRKHSIPSPSYNPHTMDYSPSLFSTTDPFYLAQIQAVQKSSATPSYFTFAGNPSQQSPFVLAHSHHSHHPFAHRIPGATDIAPQTMFA